MLVHRYGGISIRRRGEVRVETQNLCLTGRQIGGQFLQSEKDGHLRIFNHEDLPHARICRIERDIRAPCLEDAEHADQHLRAAERTEPHQRFRAGAQLDQAVCHLIGAAVQFRVKVRRTSSNTRAVADGVLATWSSTR